LRHPTFAFAVAVAAALAFTTAASAQSAKPMHKITIATPGPALHFFPAHVADVAGLFAAEGIDAEWLNVGSGTKQVAAVASGSAAMTVLGMQPAITAADKGADLVAFAALFNKYPIGLLLRPDVIERIGFDLKAPIDQKVKKLNGLTIGITGVGSSTDTVLRSFMLARGIDPDKTVRIQPLGDPNAMIAAMEKKLVDGVMLSAPQAQIVESKGAGKMAIDPLTGEVPELNGVPYTAMISSRAFMDKNPEVIMAATRALTKAMLLTKSDPQKVSQLLQQKLFPNIDAQLFQSFEPAYAAAAATTPVIAKADYDKLLQWMKLLDPTPVSITYDKMISTDAATKVAAELLKK
jgi:NitT/TauT family transport system substrate-binding protein